MDRNFSFHEFLFVIVFSYLLILPFNKIYVSSELVYWFWLTLWHWRAVIIFPVHKNVWSHPVFRGIHHWLLHWLFPKQGTWLHVRGMQNVLKLQRSIMKKLVFHIRWFFCACHPMFNAVDCVQANSCSPPIGSRSI